VLVEQSDAGGTAFRQAVAEGAGQDDVAPHVLGVEQAGVAREGAVGLDALQVEGGEFEFVRHGLHRVKEGSRE
jgi:hypothetical protein